MTPQSEEVNEQAERATRMRRTIELRIQGLGYRDIMTALGYSSVDEVKREIQEFLTRLRERIDMEEMLEDEST